MDSPSRILMCVSPVWSQCAGHCLPLLTCAACHLMLLRGYLRQEGACLCMEVPLGTSGWW